MTQIKMVLKGQDVDPEEEFTIGQFFTDKRADVNCWGLWVLIESNDGRGLSLLDLGDGTVDNLNQDRITLREQDRITLRELREWTQQELTLTPIRKLDIEFEI